MRPRILTPGSLYREKGSDAVMLVLTCRIEATLGGITWCEVHAYCRMWGGFDVWVLDPSDFVLITSNRSSVA